MLKLPHFLANRLTDGNEVVSLTPQPSPWKEAKVITLPKPGKDPKFPQNLRSISLLSTTGKLFKKVILKIFQKPIEEKRPA
jgi:hypothetical protein